jgi:hypothetical protein
MLGGRDCCYVFAEIVKNRRRASGRELADRIHRFAERFARHEATHQSAHRPARADQPLEPSILSRVEHSRS